jgi:drug/metabolite transporter (DMT)-like permease
MTEDKPILGITLMLGFCVTAPMADTIAKLIGGSLPILQVVLIRFALQVLVLLPLVWSSGRTLKTSPRILRLLFLRTLLHIAAIGMMFTALIYLELADAVAIAFVMPFFMLILGRLVLDEVVGTRRMVACLVGFAGTLLVVQPSFVTVGWPALLPMMMALIFAVFMLITRQIAKEADPVSQQAISGIMAVGLLCPLLLAGDAAGISQLTMLIPDQRQWFLLLGLGLLGTLAHLLMTWSLRYAPSTTLAPMQYLEIPFATVFGFLVFGDLPDAMAATGIALIMAAGLYVISRERTTARHQVPSNA